MVHSNERIKSSNSDQLFDMLMQKDEITWQTIIQDLIKSEQMNPWDIDISLLAQKYLEAIKKLREHNFFISGKIVLASSILLRIKSNKLLMEDIASLDSHLFSSEGDLEELEDFNDINLGTIRPDKVTIIPRMPQPRKRKVSMQDLINALHKALDVQERRVLRKIRDDDAPQVNIPKKEIDIAVKIKEIYQQILDFFKTNLGKEKLTFTKLVRSDNRMDKIYTFIPLLHLDNQEKINLEQKEHFGEIEINILNN